MWPARTGLRNEQQDTSMRATVTWLRTKIALKLACLSVLATVFGTVLTLLQSAGIAVPKWVCVTLIALAVLVVAILVALLRRLFRSRRGRPERRFLAIDMAQQFLRDAVNPQVGPICRQILVTHASGTGIAALGAKDLRSALRALNGFLGTVILELRLETRFTLRSVLTHLRHVSKIAQRLGVLASAKNSHRCFRLPNTETMARSLAEGARQARAQGVRALEVLLESAPHGTFWDKEHPTYKHAIKHALTVSVYEALRGLRSGNALLEGDRQLSMVIEALEKDWHSCLTEVWEDDLCKPDRRSGGSSQVILA